MAKNKVMFGVSKLHFGLYTVEDDDTVTLGEPMHVPGTVNISLEADSEENKFYADNDLPVLRLDPDLFEIREDLRTIQLEILWLFEREDS